MNFSSIMTKKISPTNNLCPGPPLIVTQQKLEHKETGGDVDSFRWILFMATCECALRSPSLLIQGSCFVLIKVCLTLSFFALLPCYIYSLTMLCLNRLCRCLLQVPLLRSRPPRSSAIKVDMCSRKEQGGSIFEVQKKLTKESL
jgi:hypothetical protein